MLANATVTTNELRIESGTRLGGIGSISGDLINHGFVSPGNSPGTINVGGDYVQSASGGRLSEIQRTGTDLIDVTGSASFAGTHQIQIDYGLYLDGTLHTLLSAAGGITGTYDTASINPSALMTAEHTVGVNAETIGFTRQSTTTVTTPGTNKDNFAEWIDEQIAGGGLTPEMEQYIDTLLQQPAADLANSLLGEIADPVASVGQQSVSILSAGYANSVFERFTGELAQCTTTQESTELLNCSWATVTAMAQAFV